MPKQRHFTALEAIETVGAALWIEIFTFALVRHPYAKVVSHYLYRVQRDHGGMGDGHVGLDEWVLRAYRDRDPRYYNQPRMFAPCVDWISDARGAVLVEKVYRLEEIAVAWPEICARTGISVALPHENRSFADRPRPSLGAEAKRVVGELFAADFERFGYVP